MLEKKHKRIILIICLILSLSSIALTFSGCNSNSNEKVLASIVWNRKQIVVNGYEYVLMESYGWNGTWEWNRSIGEMNKIGKIRALSNWCVGKANLWASNEDPPICLYVAIDGPNSCYLLKTYSLPSKLTASFSSIDFGKYVFDFDNAVSMEDIISYENAILLDEDYEMEWIDTADLYYSEHYMIYLYVNIYRINERFYIRLDDVFYPIVMPEVLDYLNTKK